MKTDAVVVDTLAVGAFGALSYAFFKGAWFVAKRHPIVGVIFAIPTALWTIQLAKDATTSEGA